MTYHRFVRELGIDDIFSVQAGQFTSTTKLGIYKGEKITVSDVLKAAGYMVDFIKMHFDIEDRRYSEALLFLKAVNLTLNNQQIKKPSSECMHFAVDVFHQVADMQTSCPMQHRANARTAFVLNAMIDMFDPS